MSAGMQGAWITYSAKSDLEAWWVPAEGAAPRGTVLLLQEIFGVNAAMRAKANLFAAQGFNVIAPDLFSHLERRVDLGYAEADRKRGFELMQKLDGKRALADCAEAARWAQAQSTSNGSLAVVGFCIGGLLAVQFAAEFPCAAAASFYGVRVHEQADTLRRIACPFQYHVGDQDGHIPAASVAAAAAAVATMPRGDMFIYPGAGHGFFNLARQDVYHAASFELAQARVMALLQERLQ